MTPPVRCVSSDRQTVHATAGASRPHDAPGEPSPSAPTHSGSSRVRRAAERARAALADAAACDTQVGAVSELSAVLGALALRGDAPCDEAALGEAMETSSRYVEQWVQRAASSVVADEPGAGGWDGGG